MNQSTNYDPPEAVVPVAFRELLQRLRRARTTSPRPSEINEEERKAFEYGVQQRRRVLEHTLFLVFGQWALYRQAVSKLQSRGLRLLYGTCSVLSTVAFVRHRASHVSADMFAHIVTTGVDSPLGNEARIVLAELEGPEGPYFRHVCRERGFQTDLFAAVALMEEGGDPVHDIHPQLRLRPRLLNETQTPAAVIRKPDIRNDSRYTLGRDFRSRKERPVDPALPDLNVNERRTGRLGEEKSRTAGVGIPKEASREEKDVSSPLSVVAGIDTREERHEQVVEKAKERKRASISGEPLERETKEDVWGKPFDFAQAASASWEYGDEENAFNEDKQNMTPSQRRAAERRERRMRGRARLDAEDGPRLEQSKRDSGNRSSWDSKREWGADTSRR